MAIDDPTATGDIQAVEGSPLDSAKVPRRANGMSQRWQRRFTRRLLISDVVAITLAVGLSQYLSFGTQRSQLYIPTAELGTFAIGYSAVSFGLIALWVLALSIAATRDEKIVGSGATEYRRVIDATLRLFGVVAIAMFLLKSELGRGYFLTALPLGLVLLLVGRWLQRSWLMRQRREGRHVYRALLVGNRKKTEHVVQSILRDGAGSGISMIGALTKRGSTDTPLVEDVPVLGDYSDVLTTIDATGADTLIFTGADDLPPRALRELGWELQARGVDLIVAPSLTDVAGPRIHSRPVAGLPLIHVEYPTFEGTKYYAKRAFDIVASGLGLIVLSPVLLAIAWIVRRDSPGPALFRQERVGVNGATFRMLKFRSMVTDAEAHLTTLQSRSDGNGVLFKMRDDPRVTRSGRVLRRYSLDELPQLVNVFRGEMSLVGPRPPLRREVEKYDHWARRRLLVKPGITGLWQVSGRSDLSWEDTVRLDLYYVENWSLTGDIQILWRTARAIVKPSGAY